MRAIVVGATGAVGRDLVEALCADPRYTEVRTFTRRELGVDDPKLRPYVVDFERTEGWHDLVQGDVIFSALGTSKKQAGSKEAQYHIDHDYQLMFATFAKQNGVRHMVLVSSAGADTGSSFFYMKLKGVIERDVEALGFAGLTIVQPPSLIRKRSGRSRRFLSRPSRRSMPSASSRAWLPSRRRSSRSAWPKWGASPSRVCGASASRPSAASPSRNKMK